MRPEQQIAVEVFAKVDGVQFMNLAERSYCGTTHWTERFQRML